MSELLTQVTALCDEALVRFGPGPGHDRIAHAKRRLLEPLRVAIAGNFNAGKSTLLNALLGERIAPTEQGECTQVVTWFYPGFPQRAELVLHDGRRRPLALEPGGRLPRTLGVELETVDRIEVHRSNAVLEKMVLIDTPGLGSANVHISERTERMLGRSSRAAADRADALIYVMTQLVRGEDQLAISAFRAQFPDTGSAVNAVGVLNKADKGSGSGAKRRADAAKAASKYAGELSALLTGIVPMVGLLAETAVRLDEDDARALRTLAGVDAAKREYMLEEREDFMRAEADVPAVLRARLWEMLDVYGLEACFGWLDEGVKGAKALRARLAETSGIGALDGLIHETFDGRSGVLRVGAAVGQLEAVAYAADAAGAAARTWLRDALDDLRLEPTWHELAGLRALREAAALEDELGADLMGELRRLTTGFTPAERLGLSRRATRAECADAALAGAARWRRATVDWIADAPELARIGKVAQRSFTLILKEVRG